VVTVMDCSTSTRYNVKIESHSQQLVSQHAFKSVYKSPFLSFCFVVEFAAVFSGKAIATNASGRTAEMGGIL
jgi:hypothetical protein